MKKSVATVACRCVMLSLMPSLPLTTGGDGGLLLCHAVLDHCHHRCPLQLATTTATPCTTHHHSSLPSTHRTARVTFLGRFY